MDWGDIGKTNETKILLIKILNQGVSYWADRIDNEAALREEMFTTI